MLRGNDLDIKGSREFTLTVDTLRKIKQGSVRSDNTRINPFDKFIM